MTLHGIDVSHWQQGLSLSKAQPDFAIFKATDGTSYVDSTCNGFVNQAKAIGIPYGVYHFWQGNPVAEADHFIASVKGYLGEALLVLDFEGTQATSVSEAKSFLDRVYAKTGIRPVIYMSQSVTNSMNWSSVAKDYALWVARYGTSSYGSTGAWKSPLMWQYTSTGRVNGYSGNVDKDYFYGTRDTWAAFATGDKLTPDGTDTDNSTPDGGDDVPDYNRKVNTTEFTVKADGEWHLLPIGDADDDNDYNLIASPPRTFDTDLFVSLKAANDREVQLRWVQVDTKSGQPTKQAIGGPTVQYSTRSGWNQLGYSAAGQMVKAASGWNRRLRFQVRGYTPGDGPAETMTISRVDARALVW